MGMNCDSTPQGAEPLRSRWFAGWCLNWQHQWSVCDYRHLGPAYNYGLMSRSTNQFFPPILLLSPTMQAAISSAMADDLLAIQAHLTMRPSHTPRNLIVAVSWQAVRSCTI